ncbi:MAG: DUF2510 domain-containing protein [Ilumatobacteraceae bacterium]
MRIQDAPPAGWYPDPEGTARLRFWEGTDWTDRYRARPAGSFDEGTPPTDVGRAPSWSPAAPAAVDPAQLVEQVRLAARQEAERAAELFAQQARSVTGELQPLISQYTSAFGRIVRRVAVIAVVIAIAWVAWQVVAQAALLDWLGDRIDGLGDR